MEPATSRARTDEETVEVTLEQFMSNYHAASSLESISQAALNHLLVKTFVRGHVNGQPQPVGLSSFIVNSQPEFLFDVDSFVYVCDWAQPHHNIPFTFANFDVYFRPNFNYSVKKNLGLACYYNDAPFGSGKLSACPNVNLACCGGFFVNACFPALRQYYCGTANRSVIVGANGGYVLNYKSGIRSG
ncbi:uncharacterized protein EV154DRAFT_477079 [Mucor mucedo]|uniref:uncharacterized protein n=1 Tax=Mucor mucedo TaxID=29922 RepID=UPI00221F67CF|nr:uncharacterized protein EV154DRAFT_477079 [Mucor mucedo]KAI7895627.1 hypothetical protein EV154DRAFT_477079 [Mucor mucedo]